MKKWTRIKHEKTHMHAEMQSPEGVVVPQKKCFLLFFNNSQTNGRNTCDQGQMVLSFAIFTTEWPKAQRSSILTTSEGACAWLMGTRFS